MRAISIRALGKDQSYVRISPFIMPAFSIVPGPPTAKFEESDSRAFRFWIPIDDTSTWFYILTMRDTAVLRRRASKCAKLGRCRLSANS